MNALSLHPRISPRDTYVGARLREIRLFRGLSQHDLGKSLGVTFQQIQKIEKGHNRIGAGRLFDAAQKLGVSVGYFFEGLEGGAPVPIPEFNSADVALLRGIRQLPPKSRVKLAAFIDTLVDATTARAEISSVLDPAEIKIIINRLEQA